MSTRNIDARVLYIAQRCHSISPRLINKEQLIICLNMLNLVNSTDNVEFQQRYIRMALTAYGRALKENSLPVERDMRNYREGFIDINKVDEFIYEDDEGE